MTAGTLDLAQIRARAEAATAGPWFVDESPGFEHHVRTGGTTNAIPPTGEPICDAALDEDAAFVAAARTDVPLLLDAVQRVLDLADEWEARTVPPGGPQLISVEYVVAQLRAAVGVVSGSPEGDQR